MSRLSEAAQTHLHTNTQIHSEPMNCRLIKSFYYIYIYTHESNLKLSTLRHKFDPKRMNLFVFCLLGLLLSEVSPFRSRGTNREAGILANEGTAAYIARLKFHPTCFILFRPSD